MTIKERIKRFDKECYPFYLVDHDDGIYSLCLVRGFLSDKGADFGQYAFDAYAKEIGTQSFNPYGRDIYGNGYEWGYVFMKAFGGEPDFWKLSFDCECGGFFCYSSDFDLLEDCGRRFKQLVEEDKEGFTRLVSEALKEEEQLEKEAEQIHRQVRGFLMRHRSADIDMLTPHGRILLLAEVGQNMLGGRQTEIRIGETLMSADEFLNMKVEAVREDLIEAGYFQMKTELEESELESKQGGEMIM